MEQFELYFSHSWREKDVQLNVLVWEALSGACALSVDTQGDALKGQSFYVNRLEYLIGSCDAFVSVLAYRTNDDSQPEINQHGYQGDFSLKCSKPSLFELRLAERARKPRFVVYDSQTRFRPKGIDQASEPGVRYLAIDTKRELERNGEAINHEAKLWLSSLAQRRQRGLLPVRNDATIFVDPDNARYRELVSATEEALIDSRFSHINIVTPDLLDSDVVACLQASDLLIAEVGGTDSSVLGIAHALFVPAIRFLCTQRFNELPTLLTGHPYGYQYDQVVVSEPADLKIAVLDRISSLNVERSLIRERAQGSAYFRGKLNRSHKVFLSHNLKGPDVGLTKTIISKFLERGINAWEYQNEMTSGVNWQKKLSMAMNDTTDVVFLADDDFEASGACWDELIFFSQDKKFSEGRVFPFLVNTRSKPIAAFAHLDNQKLSSDHGEAAKSVVERVASAIKN